MAKFLLPILLGLASLQAAVAAPTPETLPELVTGPGLPTLAELNLTLADLRTMSPPSPQMRARAAALFGRGNNNASCLREDDAYVATSKVNDCINYVRTIATSTQCAVYNIPNREMLLCGWGSTVAITIGASDEPIYKPLPITCNDIALAAVAVMDQCTRKDQTVAGIHSISSHKNIFVRLSTWSAASPYFITNGMIF